MRNNRPILAYFCKNFAYFCRESFTGYYEKDTERTHCYLQIESDTGTLLQLSRIYVSVALPQRVRADVRGAGLRQVSGGRQYHRLSGRRLDFLRIGTSSLHAELSRIGRKRKIPRIRSKCSAGKRFHAVFVLALHTVCLHPFAAGEGTPRYPFPACRKKRNNRLPEAYSRIARSGADYPDSYAAASSLGFPPQAVCSLSQLYPRPVGVRRQEDRENHRLPEQALYTACQPERNCLVHGYERGGFLPVFQAGNRQDIQAVHPRHAYRLCLQTHCCRTDEYLANQSGMRIRIDGTLQPYLQAYHRHVAYRIQGEYLVNKPYIRVKGS